MNQHAVVANRDPRIGCFFAVLVELGGGEINVVSLPLERRKAHVQIRILDGVDAAALVVLAGKAERIEYLHLIAGLQVATAVGTALTPTGRLIRQTEFEMQLVTLKFLDAVRSFHQQAVLGHLSGLEVFGGLAVEQHHGAFRRLGPELRAFADGAFDGERLAVTLKRQLATGNALAGGAALKRHLVAIAGAIVLAFFRAVVTGTRQAPREEDHFEFATAQGNDLRADIELAAKRPGVFTLEFKIGVDFFGVGSVHVLGRGNRV